MNSTGTLRALPRSFATPVLAALTLALLSGCVTLDPRGRGAGTDFFRKDFRCRSGRLLGHEKTGPQHRLYRLLRSRFAADSARRKRARIVLTGDSTAMFFAPDRLRRFLPGVDIVNRGIGGDTTKTLLMRLEDVRVLRPRIVVLAIGGNDILVGRCFSEVLAGTRRIIAGLRQGNTDLKVILVSIPPVWTHRANSVTPYYNRQLEYLAASLPRVSFLDLWPTMARKDHPQLRSEYWLRYGLRKKVDQVHFNERGYREWARLLRPLLK